MKTPLHFVPLCLLPLCLLFSSCVSYKDREGYFGAVGTDADEVILPGRLHIKGMNNSKAFSRAAQIVEKMWNAYLMQQAFTFLSGRYYDQEGKLVDSATTVKLQELKNAASEAEAASKLKELEFLHKAGA